MAFGLWPFQSVLLLPEAGLGPGESTSPTSRGPGLVNPRVLSVALVSCLCLPFKVAGFGAAAGRGDGFPTATAALAPVTFSILFVDVAVPASIDISRLIAGRVPLAMGGFPPGRADP